MDEQFKDTVIEKANSHEVRISELESKITTSSEIKMNLDQVRQVLTDTQELVASFPVSQMKGVVESLDANTQARQQPQKIQHHHHFNWVSYVAAGLFLLLCLLSAGWYMTAGKLDGYIANDTKYRYLKLQNSTESKKMILKVDSLFRFNSDFRDWVLTQEENRHQQASLSESIKSQQQKLRSLQLDTALSNK